MIYLLVAWFALTLLAVLILASSTGFEPGWPLVGHGSAATHVVDPTNLKDSPILTDNVSADRPGCAGVKGAGPLTMPRQECS